uniref:metallophosphoesterase family protein n=1 Tax=uncultured Draconibacterium sp. TaxID=1573823 RepID=UPI003216C480
MKCYSRYIFVFILLCFTGELVAQEFNGSTTPEHLILNLTENPSESVAVTWRTRENTDQYVQWVEATVSPVVALDNQSKKAKSNTVTYENGKFDPLVVTNHSVYITGLKPNTAYLFRVGSDQSWSEWLEYKTATDENEPFSFIYFGDVQTGIKSQWSRVIRKAYATEPTAGFIFYAGDLINRANSEKDWAEWFYAGGFIHATIPSIMTPGNHEYNKLNLDNHWRNQFTLPQNGPDMELLDETVYYVDYQNLRIISIDADMMDESSEALEQTVKWLEKTLEENSKKWTILTLHYPFYSTKASRDNAELRNNLQPIIEKYGVDMVLTGHDHAYGRGMKNIKSMTKEGEISGPVYVVSVSGTKQYDSLGKDWMTRKGGNTQLFQVISISNNTLNFKAYMATGELYDEFDLLKRKGQKNKLIDKIPDIPERMYKR